MFEKLWEGNQLAMKNVLEETDTKEDSLAKTKAKNYYVSCMDPNGTIEGLGGKPLLQLLHNHLNDWDLLFREPKPSGKNNFTVTSGLFTLFY